MKKQRIYFGYWGASRKIEGRMPEYAIYNDEYGYKGSVIRAIERKTGYQVISARPDGTSLDKRGEPQADHYELTLGERARYGGYNVEGRVWIAIPVRSRR